MNLALLRLSPTTRYAFCGMAYLAGQNTSRFSLAEDVAAAEQLPAHFLAKIFQQLAQNGLLKSRRGPGGGYALATPPEKMTLWQIVSCLEDLPQRHACFLESRGCDGTHACRMHEAVRAAEGLLDEALKTMTLADLRRGGNGNGQTTASA